MAAGAMRREVNLAGFGVARDNVEEFVFHAIGGGLIAGKKEGGDIENLCVGEAEGRHAFGGAAVADDGRDFFAGAFIVQNEDGANEVGPAVATVGVGAMAETTVGYEEGLAAFDGIGIGRRADS